MSRKGHCLSSECLQEPPLKTQPHTLTAGNPSDCTGTPCYTAGTWSCVVLSLVPVSTDEGTDVLKEAMGLAQRHSKERLASARLLIQGSLHDTIDSSVQGLSLGWRCVKQEQWPLPRSSQLHCHPGLLPSNPFPLHSTLPTWLPIAPLKH